MTSFCSLPNSTVVIGFEKTLYVVDESAELVTVAVAVSAGEDVFTSGMMDSIQIRLNTQSGSATGNAVFLDHNVLVSHSL